MIQPADKTQRLCLMFFFEFRGAPRRGTMQEPPPLQLGIQLLQCAHTDSVLMRRPWSLCVEQESPCYLFLMCLEPELSHDSIAEAGECLKDVRG